MNCKIFRLFVLLACLSLGFASCGGGDDDDNGGGTTEKIDEDDNGNGGGTTTKNNANKNEVTSEKAVSRLEFPKLKGGNSTVIVYRTSDNNTYDADRVNFCVEWDCDKKAQRWSCYQMHAGYTGGYNRVVDGYMNDTSLPSDSYYADDYYYGSGYQHGHICPNADRKYSYYANYQTYYLTNMQPQYPKFNGYSTSGNDKGEGLWVRMEDMVRTWSPSGKADTLYVCKGGTIDSESDIIERIQGKLIVPKYFFMACLLKKNGSYSAIAFFVEQKNEWGTNDDLYNYVVSIDQLEARTGIDFFCNLPDDIENSVESKTPGRNFWGFK